MDAEPAQRSRPIDRWMPGVRMLRTYRASWLRPDLIAGAVLAAILVPQGMAYAELAGLPPVTGLYTTIACLVGYAFLGPSRILVLGPDSSVSPLIFAAIAPLLLVPDPSTAIALAGMMALIVGAIEIGLGLGKLGFVADLLSKEVQVGYMNGLAITIIVGQLPKLFGFSTDADDFIAETKAFVSGLDQTNTTALAIGVATLAVLMILPRITTRVPAVLVAVVGATVATALLDLGEKGVKTVGALPQGLPTPSIPHVSVSDLGPLLIAALGIVLVSLTDTIATSTSFAARRGDEIDPNQEMIGMGAANVAAGLFQGFAISASGSRTAVAEQAGSKSQVTGLAGAAIVAILLLFLPWLLQNLPQPALAAVVIAAALSLLNVRVLRVLREDAPLGARDLGDRHVRRDLARRPAGHPDRRRALDPAVLPAQLVAARRGARACPRDRGVAQRRSLSRGRARRGRGDLPLGGAAVLRQRRDLPRVGARAGSPRPAPLDRAAVRGDHGRRRDGGRHAGAPRHRAERPGGQHGVRRAADPLAGTAAPIRAVRRPSIGRTCSRRSSGRSRRSRPRPPQPAKREGRPRATPQSSRSHCRQRSDRAAGE